MPSSEIIAEVGENTLEVIEPDLIIYRLRGVVDGHHMRALREAEGKWNEGKPYLLVLVDISGQQSSTMEARKASTEPALGTKHRAIAICGGNHYNRILVDLVLRALRMLTPSDTQMRFIDTEENAKAWLFAQRQSLASRG